jgi:hypothetical protein
MANRLPKRSERFRGKIMEMVKQGQKTLKAASLELAMSYPQAKRVYRRYLGGGDGEWLKDVVHLFLLTIIRLQTILARFLPRNPHLLPTTRR